MRRVLGMIAVIALMGIPLAALAGESNEEVIWEVTYSGGAASSLWESPWQELGEGDGVDLATSSSTTATSTSSSTTTSSKPSLTTASSVAETSTTERPTTTTTERQTTTTTAPATSSTSATTTFVEETSTTEGATLSGDRSPPPPDGGLRETERGVQADFASGLFDGMEMEKTQVLGFSVEADYSMAVEVISASWFWIVALLLLIATAIVSGLDRRRGEKDPAGA